MKTYFVTWIVLHFTVIPCTHNDTRFGCSKVHGQYITEYKKKEFTDRDSMRTFYLEMCIRERILDQAPTFEETVGRIKMDSIIY